MAATAAHTQVLALDPLPLGIIKIGRHSSRLDLIGGLVTILVNGRWHFDDSDIGDTPLHTECAGALIGHQADHMRGRQRWRHDRCRRRRLRDAPVNVVSAIAPAMAFRIVSSRYYFAIKNVSRMSEQQTARRNRSQQAAAAAWRRYLPSGAFRLESAKWAKADIEPIIPDDRI